MARAPEWVRRHQSRGLAPIAEYFLSTNEPNPLRWLVERFQDGVLHAIALAALSWLEEPGTDGKLAWEKAGLTEAQARTMVWHWWGFSSMFIDELKRSQFEKRWIGPETDGADLDDLASLWFSGDIRSRWKDTWTMPESLRRFWPERQA
ncbi:MAG: hypothetical protein IRZ28_21680 [Steroidobacteraceae bacterium]|nr:hypothetical protein [Steroidobacteraceae bacterium]